MRREKDIAGYSFSDKQTISAIKEVYKKYKYILDPHGAVGYLGLRKYLREDVGVFLETAHPAKFSEVIEKSIGRDIEIPLKLKNCLKKQKRSIVLSNNYIEFAKFLRRMD